MFHQADLLKIGSFIVLGVFFFLNIAKGQTSLSTVSPEIAITHQYNERFNINNIKNKFVVLEFWATWCAPCLAALPHLNKLQKHFTNNDEVIFLSLTNEGKQKFSPIVKRFRFNSEIISDTTGKTQQSFGIKSIPITFLIDNKGVVKWYGNPENLSVELLELFLKGQNLNIDNNANNGESAEENVLYHSLTKKYRDTFDDDKITNHFELVKTYNNFLGKSASKIGTNSYVSYQICAKIKDVLAKLLNCSISQSEIPEEYQNLAISYCYKQTNLKNVKEGQSILLEKLVRELDLTIDTIYGVQEQLNIEVDDKLKLDHAKEKTNKKNMGMSSSNDKTVLAIDNNYLEALRVMIEDSFEIATILKNNDGEISSNRYDITVKSSSLKELNKSLGYYGLSIDKEKRGAKKYKFQYGDSKRTFSSKD